MDPISIASIGIPALFNIGRTIYGMNQASKLKRPTAPQYDIPSAVQNYLMQQGRMASQDLPGRGLMEDRLGSNVAQTIGDVTRNAPSSAAALGAITNVNQRAQQAINDLGVQAAQYRAQNEARAAEGQKYLADYQEKEWEYNENLPYQRRMNEYVANKQAANANIWGGLEGIGSSVVSGLGTQQRSNQMQELINSILGTYGEGGGTKTTGNGNAPDLTKTPFAAWWNKRQ